MDVISCSFSFLPVPCLVGQVRILDVGDLIKDLVQIIVIVPLSGWIVVPDQVLREFPNSSVLFMARLWIVLIWFDCSTEILVLHTGETYSITDEIEDL